MQEEWIDDCYNIDYANKKIGIAAVFLMKTDTDEDDLAENKITTALKQDYDDFIKLFGDMRFDVQGFPDEKEYSVIAKKLKKVSTMAKDDHSCIICMFIGHGGPGVINTADGELKIHKDILPKFMSLQCMENKPKIFIFQACRGDTENKKKYRLGRLAGKEIKPDGSDMLLCYASWNGYVSYGMSSDGHGTQYLQDLHKALRMFTKPNNPRNVIDILTAVNRKVSNTFLPESLVDGDNGTLSYQSMVKRDFLPELDFLPKRAFLPKEHRTSPTAKSSEKPEAATAEAENPKQQLQKPEAAPESPKDYYYQVPSFESSLKKKLFLKIPVNTPAQQPLGDTDQQ